MLCLVLAVVTLGVYNGVNHHPFVNYDDDRYVTENSHVRSGLTGEAIAWAFTSTEQANWHPLTWISHALDWQLFHRNPAGHHLTSLLLHTLNGVLLFLLLTQATGRAGPSFFVAAVFALHPINVESVAWIAERKNVLCTLFFLLTIGAYGWYARKPGWARYLVTTISFALALMSKPMVITLPFVLLLLDYWPLRRNAPFTKLFVEKLPLLTLSAASAPITMRVQQGGGAIRSTLQFSTGVRIENAIVAYASYLWKLLWPAKLAPLYPHPGHTLPVWQILVSLLALVSITAVAWRFRARGYPLVGWLWFLGILVPVIGLVQVGDQAMADRYAYIPLIGILTVIAFGISDLAAYRKLSPTVRMIPGIVAILALSAVTYRQLGYWSSSYDLWSHTLAVTENNFIAQDNLGGALILLGRSDDAYPHFRAAAEINPRDPMSHSNLGTYLLEKGKPQDAVQEYQITIRLTADRGLLANTYANLGTAYRDLELNREARESYDESLRLNPAQSNAYYGRGRLSQKEGKLEDAIADYQQSVLLRPSAEAYLYLGKALESNGHTAQAVAAYQQALELDPDLKAAQLALQGLDHPR